MTSRYAIGALGMTLLATACGGVSGDGFKSGPQVGQIIPGPFHPINVTGDAAGKKNCLI
jgi:hypothetical protein